MQRVRRSLLGLALVSGVGWVGATPRRPRSAALSGPALTAELASIVAAPACPLASLSVLAIRAGKVVYEQQFGQRFLGAPGLPPKPATADTLYRIASVSKLVTTVGALILVEAGKLALDADVSSYLGFRLRNPAFPGQAITLRHLLSHTSSLRDEGGYSWPCTTALASVLGKEMWSPQAGPGAFFSYSNLGWGIIGTIMEAVTGERFDRLMEGLVLSPLGMGGGYNPSALPPERQDLLATLYRKRTVDTEVWNAAGPWIAQADDVHVRAALPPPGIERYAPGTNATPFSPTGGLRASAADLGKLMLMLLQGGRPLLQPASVALMQTPHWTHGELKSGSNGDTLNGLYHAWGLGTQLFDDAPGRQLVDGGGFGGFGHLGEAYGLMSIFVADPVKRNGMIVLVGGVGSDPAVYKARGSAMARFEEQIVTALYRLVG